MAFMYYRAAQGGHRDIYAGLPLINSPSERLRFDTTTPFVPSYVKSCLAASSDPAQTYASRVQGRQILLENPARESRSKKAREAKRTARAAAVSAGQGGKTQSRKRGAWKLRKEESKFQLFLPLHSLWLGYMSELLSLSPRPAAGHSTDSASAMPNAAGMHAKLIKADFHGSIVTVRQSKNPCLVGLSGIVVHETENAFKVITQNDTLKMIPKQNSIFMFAVPLYATQALPPAPSATAAKTILDMPHIEFELYGNHFCYRAAERAGRKFKHKGTIEL